MNKKSIALLLLSLAGSMAHATELEVTPWLGMTFSDDLTSSLDSSNISVSDDKNYGLSFAWQKSNNGQGMVLINRVSHNFTSDSDSQNHDLDIIYAHFNGVALIKDRNYITTVSIGLGAAYMKTIEDSNVYPSITAAIGTRYEIANNLSFVTEARMYASLTKQSDTLFCQSSDCSAQFGNATWVETMISAGIAYRF